ncbi:MAG: hypothetical protein ACLQBX_01625 [Candidatus Limnocylindrales bacterium]
MWRRRAWATWARAREADGVRGARDRGRTVRPRRSYAFRDRCGHTPVSLAEGIPWGGGRLIVGTGAGGGLRIAPEVCAEATRRGIAITALLGSDACRLLATLEPVDMYAFHLTC